MTEPRVDARELLRGLRGHDVEYVLFGALAMIFYGYIRTTEDLDIIVNPDRENLDRVAEWLKSMNAVLKAEPRASFRLTGPLGMHEGRSTSFSIFPDFPIGPSSSRRPSYTRSTASKCPS